MFLVTSSAPPRASIYLLRLAGRRKNTVVSVIFTNETLKHTFRSSSRQSSIITSVTSNVSLLMISMYGSALTISFVNTPLACVVDDSVTRRGWHHAALSRFLAFAPRTRVAPSSTKTYGLKSRTRRYLCVGCASLSSSSAPSPCAPSSGAGAVPSPRPWHSSPASLVSGACKEAFPAGVSAVVAAELDEATAPPVGSFGCDVSARMLPLLDPAPRLAVAATGALTGGGIGFMLTVADRCTL